jgi:hypothetical protein
MKTIVIRVLFFVSVGISLFLIYFNSVVLENFTVFTNPEGPDTSDYFIDE